MANYCFTTYIFESKDNILSLETLRDTLFRILNGDQDFTALVIPDDELPLGFGKIWNISEVTKEDYGYSFGVDVEDRWSPRANIMYDFVREFFSDIQMSYCAEECGEDLYCIWGPQFADGLVVVEECESGWYCEHHTIHEALRHLRDEITADAFDKANAEVIGLIDTTLQMNNIRTADVDFLVERVNEVYEKQNIAWELRIHVYEETHPDEWR